MYGGALSPRAHANETRENSPIKSPSAPHGLLFHPTLTAAPAVQRHLSSSTFCGSALSLRAHANGTRKSCPIQSRSAPLGHPFHPALTAAPAVQRHLCRPRSLRIDCYSIGIALLSGLTVRFIYITQPSLSHFQNQPTQVNAYLQYRLLRFI
jgi:hypothetical protein